MKKIIILYSIVLFGFMVIVYGCIEVKKDLAVSPEPQVHPAGWVDPASADFHGNWFAANNWKLNSCKSCHGSDYSGGTSGVSCNTCHANGPETCNTCHGNSSHAYPPESLSGGTQPTDRGVGAHVSHLTTDTTVRYSAIVACNECHLPVSSFEDPNHISPDGQSAAGIVFGTLAKKQTVSLSDPSITYTPNPVWDRNAQTCANTYCHGGFVNGNNGAVAVFNDPNSVNCGSCHGNSATGNPLPGGNHPQTYPNVTQCYLCHGGVINMNGTFKDRSRHVNGIIDIGAK